MSLVSFLSIYFIVHSYMQAAIASDLVQDPAQPPESQHHRVLQTYGDITTLPNSVNINNLYTVTYSFKPVGYITMTIQFKLANRFFGMGFGTGMTGADIMVFQIINSEVVVSDRKGLGHYAPVLDTTQGGTSDIERLGYEVTSSYSFIKIRRKLDTGDLYDAVITPGLVNMIYSYGTGPTLAYHGKGQRGIIVVPLIPGMGDLSIEDTSSEGKILIDNVHAILNMVAWGVIADIGILFVRLMRRRKIVFRNLVIPTQMIHAFIMWMVIIMSVVVTTFMIKENRGQRGLELLGEGDRDFHFINGLIILSLMIITLFSGTITFVRLRPYECKRKSGVTTKVVHQVSGVLIYLLAKANVISGVLYHDEGKWEIGVYIYLSFLFLAHIGIQIMYTRKFRNSNRSPPEDIKAIISEPVTKALVEAINRGTPREFIIRRFPDIKWVMLGNKIYNLTGWIHPGGNFIIEACVGREIGRYFYGNYNLEGTVIEPHKHSALTVSQLDSFYIGELSNYESIFLLKKGERTTLSKASDHWRITKMVKVSDNISEICFRNPHFHVKNFGKSLTWLGRHFRVSFDRDDSFGRLYTTALSLNRANTLLRQDIYRYFDEIMSGNISANFTQDRSYFASQSSISLFIKNYRGFDGLSYAIHNTKITTLANKFRLEGPIGRGLELSHKSSGTHCIVCSGTGILPMVDFLNLFLWKTMYRLIKEKAGIEKAQQINPLGIPFDSYFNDMRIKFLGAFTGPDEILGLDIIKKLAEIDHKYNTNNFEAIIKGYSNEHIQAITGDFSSISFLGKILNKRESKYYVVGPPKFNEDIPKALGLFGVSGDKIMLV